MTMASPRKILVTRKRIASAGGIKAALDEAHSLAALLMTPRTMTAYEAVGSKPTETDGATVLVQIEVCSEQELREALDAAAEAVLLVNMSKWEARRLTELVRDLRTDCFVEVGAGDSGKNA
jgi:hypothetical protein